VNEFCDLHEIDRVEMESTYIDPRQPRKKIRNYKHQYAVDCFNDVIDWLVQELDSRFSETTSQLLVCSAAFNQRDSFHAFDGETLMTLAKLYLLFIVWHSFNHYTTVIDVVFICYKR
jgi:hypothetical protein